MHLSFIKVGTTLGMDNLCSSYTYFINRVYLWSPGFVSKLVDKPFKQSGAFLSNLDC